MEKVELVIFDMDGLMFDTEQLAKTCWQEGAKEFGFTVSAEVLDRTIGRTAPDTRKIMLEVLGENFPYEKARIKKDELMLDFVEKNGTPVKPGLYELLDFLEEKKIKKAVATSTEKLRAEKLLKKAEVFSRFDAVIFGDMVERGKPFPDIFQKAAEVCGCDEKNCIVLEDSPAGVEAAWRCKMPVYFIEDIAKPLSDTKEKYKKALDSLKDVIYLL